MNWDERRIKIVEELRKNGIEPYPHKYEITHLIKDIKLLHHHKVTNPMSHLCLIYLQQGV